MANNDAEHIPARNPLVSFIVPAFNSESTIEKCIQSVAEQHFDDYELIIVDDGSTDSTGKIVRSNLNDKTKYYHKNNGGVSSARNYGLSKAAGEWIIFLDADDTITKNAISSLTDLLHDETLDFIITPIDAYVRKSDRRTTRSGPEIDKYDVIDDIIYRLPHSDMGGISITRNLGGNIIRQKVISDNKLTFIEGLRFFEDGIFNILVAYNSRKIAYSNVRFYNYDSNNANSRMNTFCSSIDRDNAIIQKTIGDFLNTINHESKSFPYLRVELFSKSLFALSASKEKTKQKIAGIKKYEKAYIESVAHCVSPSSLTRVLRIEFFLCTHHFYRALLSFCKFKKLVKQIRGQI